MFAVLTHALIGAPLADNARDKLAAREHEFLTGDFSYRALQARGMRLSAPDFIGIQAWRARLRQKWARFLNNRRGAFARPLDHHHNHKSSEN